MMMFILAQYAPNDDDDQIELTTRSKFVRVFFAGQPLPMEGVSANDAIRSVRRP